MGSYNRRAGNLVGGFAFALLVLGLSGCTQAKMPQREETTPSATPSASNAPATYVVLDVEIEGVAEHYDLDGFGPREVEATSVSVSYTARNLGGLAEEECFILLRDAKNQLRAVHPLTLHFQGTVNRIVHMYAIPGPTPESAEIMCGFVYA